jgi:Gas vesicle synthesis protein GvpO
MAGSSDNGRLSASELSQAALSTVQELTGYQPEAVTGLEWDGECWQITVDVLELSRIPSTTDVIGSYVVQLDDRGTLRGYRRTRRFQRGQPREEG